MIIGWATNVNQRILDTTSLVHGEGGYVEDGDMAGRKNRRLTSYITPDIYNVTMDFNWEEKDSNGESEYDRFLKWFNYKHRRGVNPFEFPSIRKFKTSGSNEMARYKITSSLNASKSGFCMRVTMTWEEVYDGYIEIPEDDYSMDHIVAQNGKVTIYFKNAPLSLPTIQELNFVVKDVNNGSIVAGNIEKIEQDGNAVSLYFSHISQPGIYKVSAGINNNIMSHTIGIE